MERFCNAVCLFFLILCSVLFAGESYKVSVSIPPVGYFVSKIAGDSLTINVLVPQNSDEHHLELKPQDLIEVEKSDLYFASGLEFERKIIRQLKRKGNFNVIALNPKNLRDPDPHTWLDPLLVKKQAHLIAKALSKKYPQNKILYEKNLENFLEEIDGLHMKMKDLLSGLRSNKFIVYHPSWNYFAKAYNLVQIPIEIEGKEPKPRDLQELIKRAKKENIKIVFVQEGFPDTIARNIASECGADVVSINHLSADWEGELLKTAQVLHNALK
ncbi:MAG: zinc ABC transporter substrate-binding protein [Helicobacter sp.]|nr:zinc ABC transporter substrate-binding protein [Helicobacter sp.]